MSFLSQHYVAKVEITQVELALPILGLCGCRIVSDTNDLPKTL